jgi:hypothetical protein
MPWWIDIALDRVQVRVTDPAVTQLHEQFLLAGIRSWDIIKLERLCLDWFLFVEPHRAHRFNPFSERTKKAPCVRGALIK